LVHDDDLLLSRQLRFLEDESPWQENYFRPRYGTKIAGLLPVYERSPDGGRRPKADRQVLTAILFVLTTGITWEDLPQDAFDCSYKTCLRRREAWTKIGLWQRMHELFLAKLRGAVMCCFACRGS
jgi:transposase